MTPAQRAILTSIGVTLGDFPNTIGLAYTPPKLVMTLTQDAAGFSNPINMQDTRACFEAWCLIIKAKTSNDDLKIELDVKFELDENGITVVSYTGGKPANGHLGRFLYRILKFSEQYKWFELSPTLAVVKSDFENYLATNSFETSAPSKKPKADIANCNLESYVEYLFCDSISAQKDILDLPSGTTIDRQLPVSLFEGTKAKATGVFTGGKSAIDFWALDGDTINVYELKSDNPMVGIITEIFFYSNYVYDVFISESMNHGKGSVTHKAVEDRSYNKIDGKKTKVKGIMLSNSNRKGWHSSLGKPTRNEIEKIMNGNGMSGAIQYEFLEYQLNPLKIGGYYISK